MEPLGGVGTDGDFFRGDVLDELEDAVFGFLAVGRALDVLAEVVFEFLQGPGGVGHEEQAAAVVIGHDGVHVDADQNADVGDVVEEGADGEVAGGAEVSEQGVEPFDVGVAFEDAPELIEEGLVALVSEKAGGHRVALGPGAPGNRMGRGAAGGAGVPRNEILPHCHRPRGKVFTRIGLCS